ncbi:MAG: F0F1 ATP synthase subunit delta, partial [Myxococcales bacterium]|nr:F0F1 ATP synthase subunit delta [Myxococcales bacterium]
FLVWLLKHFLYKPILSAIDQREKKISETISDAQNKKIAAQKEIDNYQNKNKALNQRSKELLQQASDDAQEKATKIIDAAHQKAHELEQKQEEKLRNIVLSFNSEMYRKTTEEIFLTTQKVLHDMSSITMEHAMLDAFLTFTKKMKPSDKNEFKSTLNTSKATLRSALPMSDQKISELKKVLEEIFAIKFEMLYEVKPELICGIELLSNGQKISWNISDYLSSMEQNLNTIVQKNIEDSTSPVIIPQIQS